MLSQNWLFFPFFFFFFLFFFFFFLLFFLSSIFFKPAMGLRVTQKLSFLVAVTSVHTCSI